MTKLKQCYRQQWLIWITHWSKNDRMGQETWKSGFVTRQCPVSHITTGERHLEIAWMRRPSTPAAILWPDDIWLSPLHINGQCACRAALQQFRISVKMAQKMFCRKTKTVFLARYSYRINLPLFSTVIPSNICMFLSCRPFIVITTFSTGLEVTSEVTSTPARPVENVVITSKGIQDRNTHILDGMVVENKGKLILTEIFPSVQKHDI